MEESFAPKMGEILHYVIAHPEWSFYEEDVSGNKMRIRWALFQNYTLIITVVPTGFVARTPDGRFQLRGSKPEILSEASDHFMSLFQQQRS